MASNDIRSIIRYKINQRRESIPQIARELDLNHQTLYNYLAGRSEMRADNLHRLFKYLGISLK